MSPIVDFYAGRAPDYLGRTLRDVWAYDDAALEGQHDYVQVLFPNVEPSGITPQAPTIDSETVAAFRKNAKLRENLARSHDLMLRFYGLEYRPESGTVVRRDDFARQAANWLTPFNHNFLRITRILKCLETLGLPERARAFFDALEGIYAEHPDVIGPRTFAFWRSAAAAG